jgi:hypothetical protein
MHLWVELSNIGHEVPSKPEVSEVRLVKTF